ncbi:MAG TPA: NADH-quinone oxidoreductase subunit N [Thermoleophilaceae bacterium]|nr:NADH-quinone oxidoreductase subunit N [Thermoleophilaceae bacterium]
MIPLGAEIAAPEIDYQGLSPLFATVGGAVLVFLAGLLPGRAVQRVVVPLMTLAALGAATGLSIWVWQPGDRDPIVENALAIDALALGMGFLFYVMGIVTVLFAWRSDAVREAGAGEFFGLMLGSISGMAILAASENLVTLFIGIELLSIPLYVLCAARVRHAPSLESGLKYLVVGSAGSATLLYGLALIYGATGATDFGAIAAAIGGPTGKVAATDPLLMTGIGLTMAGLAFKASVAPFHQWTPDVYEGAPTPVTAFMAVATKVAAFAILLRLFDHALATAQVEWGPALFALAVVTIVVGNAGAIAQRSLKRMLAWSGVAQAGYLLAGVVVGTRLGLQATVFYLAVYLLMNATAFAVVIARERVSGHGDDLRSLEGLGRSAPALAWPMTIAMLALAGVPGTAGFIGKFYLIDASVDGDWAWLGIAIVVGSMMSLVYYLRVVATMWMGPIEFDLPLLRGRRLGPIGGWSPEADARSQPELLLVAVVAAAATVFFGIWPEPLFDLARDAGTSLSGLR